MIAENGALGQPQGNEQGREVMQEQVVKQKVQLTPGTSVERMDRMVVADGPLADEKIDRRTANLCSRSVVGRQTIYAAWRPTLRQPSQA